jgi:UDP-GlcNAc:undecaprenyl-phosphate GlcNAc-1-phosphate transferase
VFAFNFQDHIQSLILLSLTAFGLSVSAMLAFRKIATLIGLIDRPQTPNSHSTHTGEIPLVGGLSILVSLFACWIFVGFKDIKAITFLCGAATVTIVGALDDRFRLSFKLRLVIQSLVALSLFYIGHVQLNTLGDLFGLGPISTQIFAPIATVVVVLGAINSFNMIDGSDGVAGGTGAVTFMSLLSIPGISGVVFASQLSLIFLFSIAGFLLFNIPAVVDHSRRCFLGDAGSTLIGFTIAFLMIQLSQEPSPLVSPVTMLWLGLVPILDLVWAITRRIIKKTPIFLPDREHLHHILKRMGLNDIGVFFAMLSVNAFAGYIGLTLHQIHCPDYISLVLWLAVGLVAVSFTRGIHRTTQAVSSSN